MIEVSVNIRVVQSHIVRILKHNPLMSNKTSDNYVSRIISVYILYIISDYIYLYIH